MNAKEAAERRPNATLEDCAAQLTQAAYRVALRHGVEDSWIELEIELWRALTGALEKWQQQSRRDATQLEALGGEPLGEAGYWRDAPGPRLKYALGPRPK